MNPVLVASKKRKNNFPQNFCVLPMVFEELVRSHTGDIYTADELENFLGEIFIGEKTENV